MTTGTFTVGSTYAPFYSQKSWSGGDDPGKHKAENAYTASITRGFHSASVRLRLGVVQDYPIWFRTTYWCPEALSFTSNDELKLLSKLTEQLTSGGPNLGAALGEMPSTLASLGDLCTAAFRGWKSFRKGRFGDAFRNWSRFGSGGGKQRLRAADVSDAHLALTYGWLPLAGDINDLCHFIEARTSEPRVLVYRVSRSVPVTAECSVSPTNYSVMAKGRVDVHLKYKLTERLSTPRALGLLNPALVAWELVPFSFVLDWFIPIGSYLEAVGLYPFLDGTCTRTVFRYGSAKFTNGSWTDGYYVYQGGGFEYKAVKLNRYAYTINVPRPGFKSIRQALSLPHFENAAALVLSGIKPLRAI